MVLRQLLPYLLLSVVLMAFSASVFAKKEYEEKHIEVALRTIGHQLLQKCGDSNSRILPISHIDGRYKIEFESELDFVPDSLFRTVAQVIRQFKIAEPFIVEVEDCKTADVVYNFEIDSLVQLDFLPCGGREYPKGCYSIFFTIKQLGVVYPMADVSQEQIGNQNKSNTVYYALSFLSLLALSTFIFIKKRKKMLPIDTNILSIGQFRFNRRNATLTINDESTELSGKEADLLLMLNENANQTMERDEILNKVWGVEGDYIGRTLDVFISKLRKKIEADPNIKIVNIRGVGYRLVLDS